VFRKHSRISDEKEVSHGYEEVEEEEDVEVNLASASPSYWGCASASSFREAQRSGFKNLAAVVFVSLNRPSSCTAGPRAASRPRRVPARSLLVAPALGPPRTTPGLSRSAGFNNLPIGSGPSISLDVPCSRASVRCGDAAARSRISRITGITLVA
jgi:hypothetical protein